MISIVFYIMFYRLPSYYWLLNASITRQWYEYYFWAFRVYLCNIGNTCLRTRPMGIFIFIIYLFLFFIDAFDKKRTGCCEQKTCAVRVSLWNRFFITRRARIIKNSNSTNNDHNTYYNILVMINKMYDYDVCMPYHTTETRKGFVEEEGSVKLVDFILGSHNI